MMENDPIKAKHELESCIVTSIMPYGLFLGLSENIKGTLDKPDMALIEENLGHFYLVKTTGKYLAVVEGRKLNEIWPLATPAEPDGIYYLWFWLDGIRAQFDARVSTYGE